MLVFIDESGDTGLKVGGGSSRYFVVSLVLFDDHEEAVACDQRIELLKRELKQGQSFEFKFGKLNRNDRFNFIQTFLRKVAGKGVVKKVKVQDSHRNNLIQLADLVAGAIQRSYSPKQDREIYRKAWGAKEMQVEIWPK